MKVDVEKHIGAVTRRVEDRRVEGKPARAVVASRDYSTGIADLWDALTNAERIPRWFLPIEGDLKLGGRYQFKGNAGGTITTCEPPKRLHATWEFNNDVSWVEVTLTPVSSKITHFELAHIAYPSPFWDQYGPGAVGVGWEAGLMGLQEHLDGGLEPTESEAWMASAEGKDFYRRSGAGWGEAEAASGVEADIAERRARETIAFYTGEPAP